MKPAPTANSLISKLTNGDLTEAATIKLNIMLIGCGPHSKRIYLPALIEEQRKKGATLKAVVELDDKKSETKGLVGAFFDGVKYISTAPFNHHHVLPAKLEKQLDDTIKRNKINGVIIATEPLSHMQYALWAAKNDLHILMDKPISTRDDVSNSVDQASELASDFALLSKKRNHSKAFIINAQRRYHPGFQYVLEQIELVARDYHIPITAMQSSHSDGQWRLPHEILTQQYHPYVGYGKVSHSGYHLIDLISWFVQGSFAASNKNFDKIGVYSSFVRSTGLLNQQNRVDYLRIFGEQYNEVNNYTDQQLAELYKKAGEAEVDSSSVITLFNKGDATANITLSLMHNSFARRDWMLPGVDLYKGNGRVKHEYHSIQQGPYQNIQIHSYQSNDKHESSTEDDYDLGGNNHFDIYIFRNSGILGGKPLHVIRSKDLAKKLDYDSTKLMSENVKQRVVQEFFEVMRGEREPANSESDLLTHALSANLMSLIYKSGIRRKEEVLNYV